MLGIQGGWFSRELRKARKRLRVCRCIPDVNDLIQSDVAILFHLKERHGLGYHGALRKMGKL